MGKLTRPSNVFTDNPSIDPHCRCYCFWGILRNDCFTEVIAFFELEKVLQIQLDNFCDSQRLRFLHQSIHCSVDWKTVVYFWFQTSAVLWILYSFFWFIPRRLNFLCRRFGTLCLFHLHRSFKQWIKLFLFKRPVKKEQSVPKHRSRKFRRRGIIQKKEYNRCLLLSYSSAVC